MPELLTYRNYEIVCLMFPAAKLQRLQSRYYKYIQIIKENYIQRARGKYANSKSMYRKSQQRKTLQKRTKWIFRVEK